jgi:N4-gp56 family major capsid protein
MNIFRKLVLLASTILGASGAVETKAFTTPSAGNQVTQWDSDFFAEYVRANRFKRYMGTDENSVIQIKEDLTVKKGGRISIPLIAKLSGAGQTGNGLLEGNEEALSNYDHLLDVSTLRHAVATTENDEQLTEIDLRKAAKAMLKNWAMEKLRTAIITALGSVDNAGTPVAYSSASAGQRNAWNVANSDRVLFGSLEANYNATHSTALATIDNTADKLTRDVVSHAKRRAQAASPIVRPVQVGEDSETYVMFAGTRGFRDLKADLATIHQNAGTRGDGNPLFVEGDLLWDGVVIRHIPEIGNITGVGAGAIDVAPAYLCGAQAVAVAWAKRTKSTTDTRDYGFVNGVGISEMRGVEKLIFNGHDHGVVTVFHAAVADG